MRRRPNAPPRLRASELEVRVTAGAASMTLEQLDRWADRYIGYILEREGLAPLPDVSDDEAA